MPDTTQFAGMNGDGQGPNSLEANTVLLNRYKVLGVLGGGGMGTVYQARDLNFPDIKRLVAIKEMQNPANDTIQRASVMKTFRREANILATLAHPAIVRIFDFFDLHDRAYLVMEYINGSDLEMLLSKTKELPIDKIIEWSITLCDVLDYLHNQPEPIIFRDMKPSNVMIDSLGKVRLIDFGIAKTFVSGVKHTMIGTEGYSAPEQYKGDVSPNSDIYSLGATLHHVLTRRDPRLEPPFSFNERPIAELNPKVPRPLIDIVEKAVSFDNINRYNSCAEMKAALEAVRFGAIAPAINISVAPARSAAPANGGEGTEFFDIASSGAIQPRWTFKTEDEIRCSPSFYRELAFIGSYDTNMWAVNLENGELAWKFPTNGGIAASPVVDGQNRIVLFGSEDGVFSAVDYRNGRISWTHTTRGRIRSTPRIAHGHAFFGSDDGNLYALMAINGRLLWEYNVAAPIRSRPFVTNELIIFGCETGEVYGIELNGNRKWVYRTKRGVISSPNVDMNEGICYVGSSDHFMYAIDANNGYNSWRFRTGGPIISSPALGGGLVYFGSADGTLYALNAQTSREKWKFTTEKPITSSPLFHEGAIYFGGTDEQFYCLDAQTGKERWKFKTGGAITSQACIANDMILFSSMDGVLYALPLVE